MIIGIDIGSTTTKAVAIKKGVVIRTVKTRAYDAITSATGALGKMLVESNLSFSAVEKIVVTGVGSLFIKDKIFGIPTERIDEIEAIGLGGMYLCKRDSVVIANIGTGTSIIEANRDKITHLGGTGVGGGTITGLSKELIHSTTFDHILNLAQKGDLQHVDLLIEDISDRGISFLDPKATASNFGKMSDTASKEDFALAIINMVFQVIGMIAVFAAKSRNTKCILVTGNGSKNLLGQNVLKEISKLYHIEFEFPEDAEYATAIGAALSKE